MNSNPSPDSLLDKFHARHPHLDVSLAIGEPGGAMTWEGYRGTASPSRPFFLASTTKLFATALVFQLFDEGKLRPDDRLIDVVPLDLSRLHMRRSVDSTATMTVAHALSHRTGLGNYLEDRRHDRTVFLDQVLAEDREWDVGDVVAATRDRMNQRFTPGQGRRAHYSDTNFQLLGAAIEGALGVDFATAVRTHITEPLRLTTTDVFDHRRHDIDTVAPIHHGLTAVRLPLAMSSFGADGGGFSTAPELLAFLAAFRGGKLFDAGWIERPQQWCRIFYPFRYGLGLMRFRLPRLLTRMRPVTLVGHSGASGVLCFWVPERDLHIVGTVNQLEPRSLSFKLALQVIDATAH